MELRLAHDGVPWRSIIGTRNLLIRTYDQVNPAILGNIVEEDIPDLLQAIEGILREA